VDCKGNYLILKNYLILLLLTFIIFIWNILV
jgi:hypothetical protein